MNEKSFIDFIENAGASKGAAVFNLRTQNVSKQAQNILKNTEYKALAKAHIKGAIVSAYNNNGEFKQKLDEVLTALNIEIKR